ncbi:MAG: saccharopine dehydrogenase NADP-binding domain-containing protein [Thermoplasmata archaeon]|nr:MAG: saccharopine dehydrogenase NADP-binding domain-containing protein [Thermoplasmata archaeon]
MVDLNDELAKESSKYVNNLIDRDVVIPVQADVENEKELDSFIEDITTIISAVPYNFNLALTKTAVKNGVNMCDLGGNTAIIKQQIEFDSEAKLKGITIVPDCGMGPGMNISLAVYAMSLLEKPQEIYIWDGGLPQNPKQPWNYVLTFNIGGLTNEYYGKAHFLRNGKISEVPCFDGYEELDFPPPLNKLEAFVTSGGLSTMPWSFEGKLKCLENKTLRYPGHWAQFRAFSELGLLGLEPIEVGNVKVTPRDFFHVLLEPELTQDDVRDVGLIRVKCIGEKEGKHTEVIVDLMDYYDEKIGFTAMQRMTGWHASIVAIMASQDRIRKGVVPVEFIPGAAVVKEARRRGFVIEEKVEVKE